MKRASGAVLTGFLLFFMAVYMPAAAESGEIEKFSKSADEVFAEFEKMSRRHAAAGKKYNEIRKRISRAKEDAGAKEGFAGFFNNLRLRFYLGRGSRAAYKMFEIEERMKELKNDYLAYVFILIEKYNNMLRNCAAANCGEMEEIYKGRAKWIRAARDYSSILDIDISAAGPASISQMAAREDVRDYYTKKMIQTEQIIFILKEEKEIRDIAISRGIETDKGDMKAIEKRLKEAEKAMERLRKKLGEPDDTGEFFE